MKRRLIKRLPVITTSRKLYPFIKLRYLLPGTSIPRPYDGNASVIPHWDGTYTQFGYCQRLMVSLQME